MEPVQKSGMWDYMMMRGRLEVFVGEPIGIHPQLGKGREGRVCSTLMGSGGVGRCRARMMPGRMGYMELYWE